MDRPTAEDMFNSKDMLGNCRTTSISFSSSSSGNVVFSFKLPEDGLALRSASVENGVPQLHFVASPKVPAILEGDVATIFRLVSENKRPEFCYRLFPPLHPMYNCRYFKQYFPDWLRWTPVGELFAEADWKMKCLHIGLRSNEEKTVFKSWSEESQLRGLATHLDFPEEFRGGPIIMSCDNVKVQKDVSEIIFPEEPKMKITDYTNSLYSKYITAIYPSVAYHDEPVLLKMQELIKLIVVVEWLYKEKGVRADQEWVMRHTSKPDDKKNEECTIIPSTKPPYSMIPKLAECVCPSKDVFVETWEAQLYDHLKTKCSVERHYGFHDFSRMQLTMFTKDGAPCPPQKCLKMSIECYPLFCNVSIQHSEIVLLSSQPSHSGQEGPTEDDLAKLLPPELSYQEIVSSMQVSIYDLSDDHGTLVRMKMTSPQLGMTTVITAASGHNNYASKDPNMPIIPGLIPNVKNWDELISELSVPIPVIQQAPYIGLGERMSTGGVTTNHIRVREEPVQKRVVQKETQRVGSYSRTGDALGLSAQKIRSQGSIEKVNIGGWKFKEISGRFSQSWDQEKGSPPPVDFIFAVSNSNLETRWTTYKESLSVQKHEEHFHGTTLACNFTRSKGFCRNGNCGVCGISSEGLDSAYIGKKVNFERFGRGFYLAPNSSKCHDYTEGADGYRAMLLCDVLPGRKHFIETKDKELTGPPPGFNSVYGRVGCELKYPEIVVYSPDAVMPRYIILYKKDGVKLPLGM